MDKEGEIRISYHDYKRRLKKITEEIKKEKKKKKSINKKSDNLIKLEDELNKLNAMYNVRNENEANGTNREEEQDDSNKETNKFEEFTDDMITNNLYSYNEVSKKALRNIKRMQRKEMEDERNEKSRNKVGEIEYNELSELLKKVNKTIHPIAPDGNCLYESIIHQLRQRITNYKFYKTDFLNLIHEENYSLDNINLRDYINNTKFDFSIFSDFNPRDLTSDILRFLTALYILQNEHQFVHFICANDEDVVNMYFNYCEAITKGVYGSEIEIKALSNILKKKITVYDVNMDISYGEDYEKELFICFHHKLYALGKHYNSVVDI
ncbi:hypothetical protein, conserved [Plasmodium gonderi]|uniref:OTU domain-containing protein n=1 Tax=Plasmodium gonderi TaxID=77519 RepID=A0A1Y1JF66_PLAGO|nr:hypothetical protein, conserved [Plasmodium gonderi]GAW81179.1 hypothetical protein, conserved [Plasmodium gonderi]